jgi:hypothetical protein
MKASRRVVRRRLTARVKERREGEERWYQTASRETARRGGKKRCFLFQKLRKAQAYGDGQGVPFLPQAPEEGKRRENGGDPWAIPPPVLGPPPG